MSKKNVETKEEKIIRIGALWNRTTEDGKRYKGGRLNLGPLGEVSVALFHETEKKSDKHPDFIMFCEKARIGAFWLKEKDGKKFLSGAILGTPANIFAVSEKKSENSADYVIVRFSDNLDEPEEQEGKKVEESF